VIDLAQVDYVSSAGLAAISAAAARFATARSPLILCAVSEPVSVAFNLGGLLSQIQIEPTRSRAVARVARHRTAP
jgi:anti-anti-sigma factor